MLLDHAGFASNVEGLGPGRRVVLWVRGCTIGCRNCMTKELWATGTPEPIQQVVDRMLDPLRTHDGLTISGGEPFQQATAVAELITSLRKELPLLHVFCYSGFTLNSLLRREGSEGLLSLVNCLMDGPYNEAFPQSSPWRGSDNQNLHVLRGPAVHADETTVRHLQIQPVSANRVRLIGIPKKGDLEKIAVALAARGLVLEGHL